MPWQGTSPLRRSSLTAELLQTLETTLAEVYANAPIGSQVVPFPESPGVDLETLGRGFKGRRGRVLLRESVNVAAAGGAAEAAAEEEPEAEEESDDDMGLGLFD